LLGEKSCVLRQAQHVGMGIAKVVAREIAAAPRASWIPTC
jgi:hypothetical protein